MADRWTDRAKRRMRHRGITQEGLTKPLGVTRGAVGHYLSGRNTPNPDQLVVLSKLLDCSLDWLLTGEGSPERDSKIQEDAAEYLAMGPDERAICEFVKQMSPRRRRGLLELLKRDDK